jgi:hypothetical protein
MEKIYCGSAKARDTQYGEELTVSVNLTECTKWFKDYGYISKDGEKHFITLKINRRKEPGKYGETHSVTVDTWKPGEKAEQARHVPMQRQDTQYTNHAPNTEPAPFPDDIPF